MPEGDIDIVGYSTADQGGFFPHRSIGTRTVRRELMTLHNLWMPTAPMVQPAAGQKQCLCCSLIRPKDRFDADTSLGHGLIIGLLSYADLMRSQRSSWLATVLHLVYRRRLLFGAIRLSPWCKTCVYELDPRSKPTWDCSQCGQEKPRAEFGVDDRNRSGLKSICNDCHKDNESLRRRNQAVQQGRTVRSYEYHIYTMNGLQQVG